MDPLLAIPIGITVGAVTSWVTVRLSLHRFREEKWWELRVRAYERVVDALHDSKVYSSAKIDATIQGTKSPDETNKALTDRAIKATQEIERAADLGAFLLGNEARERLKQYLIEKEEAIQIGEWMSLLEGTWAAADTCLQDIIELARQDLRIDNKPKPLGSRGLGCQ